MGMRPFHNPLVGGSPLKTGRLVPSPSEQILIIKAKKGFDKDMLVLSDFFWGLIKFRMKNLE